MRHLILYAAFLGAVAGYKSSPSEETSAKASTFIQPEFTTLKLEMSSTMTEEPQSSSSSTTAAATSSQTNLIEEVVSEVPVSVPPILEEVDLPNLPNRRVVTYDQRQEGQYNIRADLDNFMIVLIPAGPSEGLLDLLSKSSLRRTSHTSKTKKKHYAAASSALKPNSLKHLNYFRTNDQQHEGSAKASEAADGRTPYNVDITSANEDVQPRLNPDRQVDVLPPSYPLAYQHLMKPYHLEAESSLLPPSETGAQHNAESIPSQNSGFYRFARYIRGDNFLDSNRVTSSNRLGAVPSMTFRRQQLPLYRSDLSMGASQLYPPLDVPQFNYQSARNFRPNPPATSHSLAEEIDSKQTLDSDLSYGGIIIPSAHLPLEADLELAFNDDSILEGEAKALLSDGIERCAPGKRRDSYGVCREIEGY